MDKKQEKLYHFLLLDKDMITEENGFVEVRKSRLEEMNRQYRSLALKFYEILSIVKFYIEELTIEESKLETLEEQSTNRKEELKKEIQKIKIDYDIDDAIIIDYIKKQLNKGSRLKNAMIEVIEKEEDVVDALKRINKLRLELYLQEMIHRECVEEILICKKNRKSMEIFENLFVSSYAFQSNYNEREWVCPEQEFLDKLTELYLYFFKVEKGTEKCKLIESFEDLIEEEKEIGHAESIKIFGNIDIEQQEKDNYWLFYLNRLLEDFERLKGTYADKTKLRRQRIKDTEVREESAENKVLRKLETVAYNRKIVEDYCMFFQQNGGVDNAISILFESGNAEIRKAFWQFCIKCYQSFEIQREWLISEGVIGSADYDRIQKFSTEYRCAIEGYEKCRVKIRESKAGIKHKESIEELLEKQKDIFRYIFNSMLKMDAENKRNSVTNTFNRLYKVSAKKEHVESFCTEVNAEFFGTMLKMLVEDVKKGYEKNEVVISEFSEEKGRNQIYCYNDTVGIVLLNFTNTRNAQYKTAAVIVDKADLDKIYIQSDKLTWTFKGGEEYSKKKYPVKTYKANKITSSGGKVNIFEPLMGHSKKMVTTSHKFDLRKEKLCEKEKIDEKVWESRYYSGKVRIDMVENNGKKEYDLQGVCFNGDKNETDATMLYFDDPVKFKKFIESIL